MSEQEPLPTIKYGYTIPFSTEAAIDLGFITEEQARARGWEPTDYPPIPLRRRVRYRLLSLWDRRPRVHLGPCDHSECDW